MPSPPPKNPFDANTIIDIVFNNEDMFTNYYKSWNDVVNINIKANGGETITISSSPQTIKKVKEIDKHLDAHTVDMFNNKKVKDLESQLADAKAMSNRWQQELSKVNNINASIYMQMHQAQINEQRWAQRAQMAEAAMQAKVKAPSLPQDLIERLISFTHPDKNPNNVDRANRLTQELLKLRKK